MARRRDISREENAPLLAEQGRLDDDISDDNKCEIEQMVDKGTNSRLPFEGKVRLPRKKYDDPWWCKYLEAFVLITVISFAIYSYLYFDHVHYHIVNGYATLGYASAQHVLGQKFLHGVGVEQDHHTAMHWFRKAADQGHPHASYNLAIGHMKGIRKDLVKEGEAYSLIEHASKNGVPEAHKVFHSMCKRGKCN